MSKLQRMASCHPTEPYYAKGLCRSCYDISRKNTPKATIAKSRTGPACHPERRLYANGLCKQCYLREYAKSHAVAEKIRKRQYYQENRKRLIESAETYRASHPQKVWKQSHKQKMLARIRTRAAANGLVFTITKNDFHIPDVCPVLGIPLIVQAGQPSDCSPSLDRIDNEKGYIPGNVIVVSHRANSIKRDAAPEELRKVASFYSLLYQKQHCP